MNRFSLGIATTVLLSAGLCAQISTGPVPLFVPMHGMADPVADTTPNIVRGVPVALDLQLLYAAQRGDLLRFPSFDGVVHDLRLSERVPIASLPGAFHLHCSVEGSPDGSGLITVVGDRVMATVNPFDVAAPVVKLFPAPGGATCLREVQVQDDFCGCGHQHAQHPTAGLDLGPRSMTSTSSCSTTDEIRLMMVFDTPSTQAAGNSGTSIEAIAAHSVEILSGALAHANPGSTAVLTSARSVTYSDPSASLALHLTRFSGSYAMHGMGSVSSWRRTDEADLMVFVVGDSGNNGAAGLAFLPETDSEFVPGQGSSCVEFSASGSYVVAHEVGHNFGCQHDPDSPQGSLYRPYGQGYADFFVRRAPFEQRWALSLMAYSPNCGAFSCTRLRAYIYSDPAVTGTSGNKTYRLGTANHNNSRLVRETIGKIAAYSDILLGDPVITQQPNGRAVCLGAQANPTIMSVVATRAESYDWQHEVGGGWVRTGQTGPDLILTDVTASDLGRYRCRVTGCNGEWVDTRIRSLSQIAAPAVTRQPADANIAVGSQANPQVMRVVAQRAATYQWYRETTPNQFVAVAGQTTDALTLSTADCADTGLYRCRVTNVCGDSVDSSAALLTVGSVGEWISYGMGCAATGIGYGSTFYERFGGFDLWGGALRFSPRRGGGWAVDLGPDAFDGSYSNALGLGGDELSRNHALGFDFPLPGGGTTGAIDIDSNGWVGLVTGQHAASQPQELVDRFLDDPARIAVCWDDLDPTAGGEVYFDALPDRALVTWVGVQRPGDTRPNTFQLQLFPSGEFVLTYDIQVRITDCLIGFSQGGGVVDPGAVDLSEVQSAAPVLRPTSLAPTIGADVSMETSLSGRATLSTMLLGFTQIGVDLTLIGMPGCSQLNTGNVTLPMTRGFGSAWISFGLPDNPQLVGREIYAQSVVVEPGANAFGVLTSNGLTLRMGDCR